VLYLYPTLGLWVCYWAPLPLQSVKHIKWGIWTAPWVQCLGYRLHDWETVIAGRGKRALSSQFCRQGQGPTYPSVQWALRGSLACHEVHRAWSFCHLHPVPTFQMCGSVLQFSRFAFKAWCLIKHRENTVEPWFMNLIHSWRPFITWNVRKPKLCVLNESYTATDALPPILPARHQLSLPACVFITRDTICHLRYFLFRKFVCEPICLWWEAFMNWGSNVQPLQELWLSQQCCWGFKPSGEWCCICGWVVADILKAPWSPKMSGSNQPLNTAPHPCRPESQDLPLLAKART
jgi:hypothetical protein